MWGFDRKENQKFDNLYRNRKFVDTVFHFYNGPWPPTKQALLDHWSDMISELLRD